MIGRVLKDRAHGGQAQFHAQLADCYITTQAGAIDGPDTRGNSQTYCCKSHSQRARRRGRWLGQRASRETLRENKLEVERRVSASSANLGML
jgi:hypothetical protein